MLKIQAGQTFERQIVLDATRVNIQQRTVPATLSSELPVSRFYGQEILLHSPEAVNLTRAADGLPLLFMHQQDSPIGIVRNVALIDKTLKGVLYFSENTKANEVFRDVQGGFLKNVSIGYSVDRFEEQPTSDNVRVTGWTLLEASVVTVPADPTVGINRSNPGVNSMTEEKKTADVVTPTDAAPVVDLQKMKREHLAAKQLGAVEAIKAERQRITDVDEVFSLAAVGELDPDMAASLRTQAIDNGWSSDTARKVLLEALSGDAAPILNYGMVTDAPPAHRAATARPALPPAGSFQRKPIGPDVRMGEDARDKFMAGTEQALLIRAALVTERTAIDEARKGGLIGKSMKSLAGDFLRSCNIATNNLDDSEVVTRAMAYRDASGQTTSDFTNILANVANKSLLQGWDEAPETWQIWTRRGQLPDFKTAEISGLSGFTGLDAVPEDGEVSYGKFTDRKETIKLVQYAKRYRLSRQAVINDDLRAFTSVPRAMGRAANRKVGDITYAVLNTAGPTLNQDSILLFDTATHKNYTAAGTAPSVATLNTAFVAMARQTDPNSGAALNIIPRYLLVPVTLSNTARVLATATYDPAGTAGTLTPNTMAGRFEVVTDARMDGQVQGTAAWYLAADPNIFDTVEVAFLNGVAQPYMRENPDWAGQGVEYFVGVDFGVSALDFRGLYKMRGN